ncbi:hypothetical protein B0T19DRAFT_97250 [Cercophora scortea]|uniref:Secreted protein n=1 Tax=Cercophora scortea TaxID=314031 RepID=A0AAE0IWC5_9PEZI|nr:hypothetical protein B0T19DRAFT_97250 [Cercophora scortea]
MLSAFSIYAILALRAPCRFAECICRESAKSGSGLGDVHRGQVGSMSCFDVALKLRLACISLKAKSRASFSVAVSFSVRCSTVYPTSSSRRLHMCPRDGRRWTR